MDIQQPKSPIKFFGNSNFTKANTDVFGRLSRGATARSVEKQGGGASSSPMQINESSGAGGGSGGGGGSSGSESEEDRAEILGSEERSGDGAEIKMLGWSGRLEYSPHSLATLLETSCLFAQAYVPFSIPVFFN